MNELIQAAESNFIHLEIAFIIGLILIIMVAIFERGVKIPYMVVLVLTGLGLAFVPSVPLFDLDVMERIITGEFILALFVPPLVFEGALRINWKMFRANLLPILLLAVGGVALGTFIVAGVILSLGNGLVWLAVRLNVPNVEYLFAMPLMAAITFGALISATDPVSVIALFRKLGVDHRLSILVEGESLLNDGTSIVIFNLALVLGGATAVHGGSSGNVEISLLFVIWEFVRVAVGGVIVGLIVGWAADAFVFSRVDDRLIETTATLPAAFGAYILAEQMHLSGILAVVVAGIYIGNVLPERATPTTKIALFNFWEMFSFVVTSLIFLVIGWQIDIRELISLQNVILLLLAIIAILLARAIIVYGILAIGNQISKPISRSFQHIMYWGGLRGAISLALALSLSPDAFGPGIGDQLRLMAFGVVLFTLLVQATTIEKLIERLGLAQKSPSQIEKEEALGRLYAVRAASQELDRLYAHGVVSRSLWEAMGAAQAVEVETHNQRVRDMLEQNPAVEAELALQMRRAMLRAERTALVEAVRQDIISEGFQHEMMVEIDSRMEVLRLLAQEINSSLPFAEEVE